MNRIAATLVLAASILAPTAMVHAETAPPIAATQPAVEAPKASWIRILPATKTTLRPTGTHLSASFGIHFDAEAITPAPSATAPQLLSDVPGIPLVVLRF